MELECNYKSKLLCGKLSCIICFDRCFLSDVKSSYVITNINLLLVFKHSKKKLEFFCNVCLHSFFKSPTNIINDGSWCPYCSKPPKILCDIEKCKICFEKSFASHEKSQFLIDNVNPRFIFKGTGKKYNFKCNFCLHIFSQTIGSITCETSRNSWCPYCSKSPKLLCHNLECQICFNKSFASHEKSKYLIDKIDPRFIFKSSSVKLNFLCDICNHNYNTCLSIATFQNIWCPYCSSSKLCDGENCEECYKKSFASCENSKYIIDKIDPRKIFKASSLILNFKCQECNFIFKSEIYSISYGRWCPNCKNKTEKKMYLYFKKIYNITVHPKFNWCKNKIHLPFDFLINDYNLLIELDGNQHFFQVMNWKSPEDNYLTDIYKMKKAIENMYSIIRIRQHDFKYQNFDWKSLLTHYIKKYNEPTSIFIFKNKNVYNNYINEIKDKCKIIIVESDKFI